MRGFTTGECGEGGRRGGGGRGSGAGAGGNKSLSVVAFVKMPKAITDITSLKGTN